MALLLALEQSKDSIVVDTIFVSHGGEGFLPVCDALADIHAVLVLSLHPGNLDLSADDLRVEIGNLLLVGHLRQGLIGRR